MINIKYTHHDVEYVFTEITENSLWKWSKIVNENKYTMTLINLIDQENPEWIGNVHVKTSDNATIIFEQRKITSINLLIKRLVEYMLRVQLIYKPVQKESILT